MKRLVKVIARWNFSRTGLDLNVFHFESHKIIALNELVFLFSNPY